MVEFLCVLPLLGYHGAVILVYLFLLCQFSFFIFSMFLGVIAEFLLGYFYSGCTFLSLSWYALSICTLRCYSWLNGCFSWYGFLIWFYSWFTCWSFSWYVPYTGTLVGTSGKVDFQKSSDKDINASLCAFPIVASGLAGDGLCSA